MADRRPGRRQLDRYLAELEAMWHGFAAIYARLSPDDWRRPYGKDWTFADQPFHLAYFGRIMVAEPIEAGEHIPERERWTLRSTRDIDEWNARELARRPADHTPEQSLAALRGSHDRIRTALGAFTDDDLDRVSVFSHFFDLGFVSLREAIHTAGLHDWGELSELRFRLGLTSPEPPPAVVHRSVRYCLQTILAVCRPERARRPFTVEFRLTGPGGGWWTMRIADRSCTLAEAPAQRPDLTLRMTPDALNLVMMRRAVTPMTALLTGKLRIRGLGRLSTFRKLFPQPARDQRIAMRALP